MKKPSSFLRLAPYLRLSRLFLVGSVFSAILTVALSLIAPRLIGRGVDALIEGQVDFDLILSTCALLLAVYLTSALCQWVLSYCNNTVSYRTVKALREDAFRMVHAVPLKTIDGMPHGDIVARITADAEAVGDGLLQGLSQFITGAATIIGTLIFLLGINGWIALVVLLLTPLSILVARQITARSHHLFKAQSVAQGELSGFVSEMVGNQKLVAAFSHEDAAVQDFDQINQRLHKAGYRAQLYGALVNPVTRFVNNIVYVAVGVVGGLIALGGGLSVGAISACLSYASSYTKPFNEISGVMTQLQTAYASLARIFALLDAEKESVDRPSALTLYSAEGNICFNDVQFGYVPEKPLIEHMQLTVRSKQKIAIVGPTGAGKTTLVNLLMRFYDVNAGDITIDGVSIYAMSRDGLRSLFGMVLQESWLMQGTVHDNIAYGRPDASREAVTAAAKAAHAHGFIKRLPKGYDTIIGEHAGLSEGQKQLMCIARVMLADPPMLILDEATSAIDTRTEVRIAKAFDEMMVGRTSFIVAHRLSTIQSADVILVMRDGHIVEQGNHDALLRQNGFYAHLYNSQFVATKEELA